MHLSRFITIAICAMTFIVFLAPLALLGSSVGHRLAAAAHHGDLVALVAGGPQIVEPERVLSIAAGHMAGLDAHPGQRVVVAAAFVVGLGTGCVDGALLYVVDEHHTVGHAVRDDRPAHVEAVGVHRFDPIIVVHLDFG